MARSKVGPAIITPILDLMQTMPSFVYLLPFVIFFGIGAAAAALVTLVYALPPVIADRRARDPERLVDHHRGHDSLGQTRWQRLARSSCRWPSARSSSGVNQTMMAALSMVTIAAFIDGPGLGQPVIEGLIRGDLGGAFVAGPAAS